MLKVVQKMHRVLPVLVGIFSVSLAILMGGGLATAENIDTTVNVKPSLTLNIPTNTILMNLDPSTHDFDEQDLTIKVGTNNFTGFKLYVTTPNNATDLVNVADSSKTIENLTTSTAVSSFPVNKWGYRVTQNATSSSGNYGVFTPSSTTPVMQSSGPINEKVVTLGFGAKIDYTKPSGLYELNLSFKAIPIATTEYMQSMSPTVCTTDPTVVIDQRDENAYLVQRLDDGKCWMLDNLQLDLTNEAVVNTLTTANTNIDTTNDPNALNYLKNGGGTTSDRYPTSGLTLSNWTTEASSYSAPLVNVSGSCSTSSPSVCTYNGNYNHNDVISTLTPSQSNFGEGTGRIGILYNYCAASAGTYCYGNGSNYGASPGNNATSDICPAGWRMPADDEYNYLYNAVAANYSGSGSVDTASDPMSYQSKLSTPLSGYYYISASYSGGTKQGANGLFWSSTYKDSSHMYNLNTGATTVLQSRGGTMSAGLSVRCVLKDTRTLNDISTMQEMTHDIVNNTAVGTSKSLVDVRESGSKSYTVTKLADGNIWMTQNLQLGRNDSNPNITNIVLTSSDSDISNSTLTLKVYDAVLNASNATTTDTSGYCGGTSTSNPTGFVGLGYTTPCMHSKDTDNNRIGVWYNYVAATAGEIVNDASSDITAEATQSICPRGWRLPSKAHATNLINAVSADQSAFNFVAGGHYMRSILMAASYGYWWTSTAYDRQYRNTIDYGPSTLKTGEYRRTDNFYIRCIAR